MTNPIKTSIITYDEDYRDNSKETTLMYKYCGVENNKIHYLSKDNFETVTTLIQKLFTEDTSVTPFVKLHNYWICLEYYGTNESNDHVYIIYGTKFAIDRLQCINEYYKQEVLVSQ